MISRIVLTLALASSVACVAAQEKPQPPLPLCEDNTILYSTHAKLIGCGLGLATGVACSAFENKTGIWWPCAWMLESTVRYGAIYHVLEFQREKDADASALASRIGSWVGYLGHWIATA